MNFVGPLLSSSNRNGIFDSITIVICLLTAMVESLPSRINYRAPELAELMFEGVYKHHGLPKNIISDQDVLFTVRTLGNCIISTVNNRVLILSLSTVIG